MLAKSIQRPQVLCVDDEPRVFDGLKLTPRRRFEVLTETDPATALRTLAAVPRILLSGATDSHCILSMSCTPEQPIETMLAAIGRNMGHAS